jgi:hypothetical protein
MKWEVIELFEKSGYAGVLPEREKVWFGNDKLTFS